jgi:hypothetical protein
VTQSILHDNETMKTTNKYTELRKKAPFALLLQDESDFISEWLLQLQPNITNILTSGIGVSVFHRPLWVWEGSTEPFLFTKWWTGIYCIVLYCIYFGSRNPEDIEQVNVQQYKPQNN